jgi:type VI secretion system protein ImpD/type VI secretion system protein ImpC
LNSEAGPVDLAMDAPLRQAVLGGHLFGVRHAAVAERLAALIASDSAADILRSWFGGRLPADREALEEALDRDIAALDAMLSRQLDAVLHASRLTRLEGSWRGLAWLVGQTETGKVLRIRLLPARWAELARDLERAPEFDQSTLFGKLHDEEFGMAGGEPFGLLLADYEMRPEPGEGHPVDDVTVLGRLAAVAAAAFAPVALAASPAILGLRTFAEAGAAMDLGVAPRAPDRARWRSLEAREDTRFLALLLPRHLGRVPWEADGTRADGFRYGEHVACQEDRVWTTPVFAFGAVALRAFQRYRWPGDLRGAEPSPKASGGVVEGLPQQRLPSDPPGAVPRAPLEIALTDEQERQIADSRLVALCALDGLPEASFGALPTLHRSPRMSMAVAEANQRFSAQFNNVLCASRFAHCLKIMGRDMIGASLSPEEIEMRLSRWMAQYVSGLAGGAEAAARYPLRDARVEVRETAGQPGVYSCVVHLQPHYQLDEVGAVFRLVTELSAPGRAA